MRRLLIVCFGIGVLLAGCQAGRDGTSQIADVTLEEAKRLKIVFGQTGDFVPERSLTALRRAFPFERKVESRDCVDRHAYRPPEPISPGNNTKPAHNSAAQGTLKQAKTALTFGDLATALELARVASNTAPQDWGYSQAMTMFSRARLHAMLGNWGSADRYFGEGQRRYFRSRKWNPGSFNRWKSWFEVQEFATRGHMAMLDGDYAEAEAYFRKVLVLPTYSTDVDEAVTQYFMIVAVLEQGRVEEAEAMARGMAVRAGSREPFTVALALDMLTHVLTRQGRYDEALWSARRAINLHEWRCTPVNGLFAARSYRHLAAVLAATGRWSEVADLFDRQAASPSTSGQGGAGFSASPDWGIALLLTGRTADAERQLQDARAVLRDTQAEAADLAVTDLALRIAGARLRRHRGRDPQIERDLDALFGTVRRIDEKQASAQTLQRRLANLVDLYLGLAASDAGPADAAALLRYAQMGRVSTVQAALADSALRAAAKDSETADLVRQYQDLTNNATELARVLTYRLSMAGTGEAVDGEPVDVLKERLATVRGAAFRLLQEIEARLPAYREIKGQQIVDLQTLRSMLAADEAVLLLRVAADATYVWATMKTGPVVLTKAALGEEALQARVRTLREAVDPQRLEVLADIPVFDVVAAHELYRDLLAPVSAGWKAARTIHVVADGALRQLPLGLLVTQPAVPPAEGAGRGLPGADGVPFTDYRGIQWLARSHAISTAPALSSLVLLRGTGAGAPDRKPFVGFGDPAFSHADGATTEVQARSGTDTALRGGTVFRSLPGTRSATSARLRNLQPLPETAEELRSIARALGADPNRDVILGTAATERRVFTSALQSYRTVAFATHGLVSGDLDGLYQPALALANPARSGEQGDGLLTMGEIFNLSLDADWVVLSACNTAAAGGQGAEAVSGLGRAFFYAGARALLVSNWPVHSDATRLLTTGMFEALRDGATTRADALREAMMALVDSGGYRDETGSLRFSYAHPIFWAPFVVVGDGG